MKLFLADFLISKLLKKWTLFFAIALSMTIDLQAVRIAPGCANSATKTFLLPISSAAFHPPTATWVVGSDGASSDTATTQPPLMKAVLSDINASFNFSGFSTAAAALAKAGVTNPYIKNICFATPFDNPTRPWIVYTAAANSTTSPLNLFNVSMDNLTAGQSMAGGVASNLKDANNADTAKINSVTAGFGSYKTFQGVASTTKYPNFVFALVKANASTNLNQWGLDDNDGVSLMVLDEITGDMRLVNAQNAAPNTYSAQTFPVGFISGGSTTPPTINDATVKSLPFNDATVKSLPFPNACCFWDSQLERLYIGIPSMTTNYANNSVACAVLIARVTVDNTIQFLQPVGDYSVFNETVIIATENIGGISEKIGIMNLNVMHTSTGFSYLIVYGGNDNGNVSRQVFAVPLVQTNASNSEGIIGTFAANNLTSADFSVQAGSTIPASNTPLAVNTASETIVGAGLLPILPTSIVSSMQIVNDTVFVGTLGINTTIPPQIEAPAIYYSQAIFNNKGKIVSWTDWALAAPYALGNSNVDGSTAFMAVNALTGHVMGIDDSTQTVASITAWSNNKNRGSGPQQSTSLFTQLSKDFSTGCYSFFDFNQSSSIYGKHTTFTVPVYGDLPPARLSLFGGKGTVAFVRPAYVKSTVPGQNLDGSPWNYQYVDPNDDDDPDDEDNQPAITYVQPQQPTVDFTATNPLNGKLINYMLTSIVDDKTMVTALGFTADNTNQLQDQPNGFFLAGTVKGHLYAWANTATGAGATPCGNHGFYFTNAGPLDPTLFSWQKVPNITGIPMRIESKGNSTYVLTRAVAQNGVMVDTLYRIPALLTTVADLGVSAVIIAQSATEELASALQFLDFCIISATTVSPENAEQILLATNNGLYVSEKVAGVQVATSQADAAWTAQAIGTIPVTTHAIKSIYNLIASPDRTRNPSSPIVAYDRSGVVQDPTTQTITIVDPGNTLEHSTLQRICFSSNAMAAASLPSTDYTSSDTIFFPFLSPIQKYWSDGGRRLYAAQSASSDGHINGLFSLPFNVGTEDITYPNDWYATSELRPLQNYLQHTLMIYWIAMVGDSGVLMAGTSTGVIALE